MESRWMITLWGVAVTSGLTAVAVAGWTGAEPPPDIVGTSELVPNVVAEEGGRAALILRDGPCDYSWRWAWLKPTGESADALAARTASVFEREGYVLNNNPGTATWATRGRQDGTFVQISPAVGESASWYCGEGAWPENMPKDQELVGVWIRHWP